MKRLIILITFIPWILHFFTSTKLHNSYLKQKKRNIINIISLNDYILYGVFIFFSIYYQKASSIFLVRAILFFSIFLYLFINTITKKDYSKAKEITNYKFILYILIIILIPLVLYFITRKYNISYYVMLALSIANFLIVIIGRLICHEK